MAGDNQKTTAADASSSNEKAEGEEGKEVSKPLAVSSSTTAEDAAAAKRRKDLFGDCALIEIIHLHDCLRGALRDLEKDVNELSQSIVKAEGSRSDHLEDLERRVAGRFKVIWSVFRAHSSAEDEFIWPALQSKTQGRIRHSPKYTPGTEEDGQEQQQEAPPSISGTQSADENDALIQLEYEEDHADEERMFDNIDNLLGKLRNLLVKQKGQQPSNTSPAAAAPEPEPVTVGSVAASECETIHGTAQALSHHTKSLKKHLYRHLEKEENQCMPLVAKHLSRSEIHDLVGNIMGKRSSDLIAQIMTMAVQNLTYDEREEMIKYMKQAMEGTFFDRWLFMSGWGQSSNNEDGQQSTGNAAASAAFPDVSGISTHSSCTDSKKRPADDSNQEEQDKRPNLNEAGTTSTDHAHVAAASMASNTEQQVPYRTNITGQAELERLIRAVASNPSLTPIQKNTTIQGLRDSVWKSNLRHKEQTEQQAHSFAPQTNNNGALSVGSTAVSAAGIKLRRATPPSVYLRKTDKGNVEFVWSR